MIPLHNMNPWEIQAGLMAKSGQEMPASPVLTLGSLTYMALQLEEMGELALGVGDSLRPAPGSSDEARDSLTAISIALSCVADAMRHASTRIRAEIVPLAAAGFQAQPLANADAVEILDGATDVMVTNCGFSLSTGLPGPAGYYEVMRSNLSKANPLTGRIDRDPSGKWIKGVNYTPPDLLSVLRAGEFQPPT